jgi:hypothetical protein
VISRGKTAGMIFGVLALSLLGAALYQTIKRYHAVLLWKSADATVLERAITSYPDDEGILRFRVRGSFRYQTPSGEQKAAADSDFDSREFAWVRSRMERYPLGARVKVYYDPARHDRIRFGANLSLRYLGQTLYYYASAFVTAAVAVWLWSAWKPARNCACGNKLKRYYTYCPFCGASL